MKKNNIKYLAKYEADLITGLFYDYVRQLPTSVLMDFDKLYTEESGKTLNTNFSCSACILKLVKQCSRLYFKELPDRVPEDLRNRGKI
jgi:hypothetical protein